MGNQQSRSTNGSSDVPSKARKRNENENSSPAEFPYTPEFASSSSDLRSLPVRSAPMPTHRPSRENSTTNVKTSPGSNKHITTDPNMNRTTGFLDETHLGESHSQIHVASAQYNQPPRLPLPIGKEIQLPGSPIIVPADLSSPISQVGDEDGGSGMLQRRNSVLSNTTADEDDDDMQPLQSSGERAAVPTVIEWRQGGERVYVTGTFAGWDRKFRLQRDGPSKHKDALSVMILLKPGTHHLKFIVDGEMKLSDRLPTAVDFTNILVNYLEITNEELPYQTTTGPVDIPSKPFSDKSHKGYLDTGTANATHATTITSAASAATAATSVQPSKMIPQPSPDRKKSPFQDHQQSSPVPDAHKADSGSGTGKLRVALSTENTSKVYHSNIPQYLLDLEAGGDVEGFYENNIPTPPSLPLFLAKSILNMSTPMKDDSSVLKMPNHTVLNHLATSSIKEGILATSATTRYKRKFLTTILYKPTT